MTFLLTFSLLLSLVASFSACLYNEVMQGHVRSCSQFTAALGSLADGVVFGIWRHCKEEALLYASEFCSGFFFFFCFVDGTEHTRDGRLGMNDNDWVMTRGRTGVSESSVY